jgi:hypothetical protein
VSYIRWQTEKGLVYLIGGFIAAALVVSIVAFPFWVVLAVFHFITGLGPAGWRAFYVADFIAVPLCIIAWVLR